MRGVRHITLFLVFFISLGMPGKDYAKAQDEHWKIRINQLSTVEGSDAMILKVYANIFDERTGTPMLKVDAQSAQITLLNTNYTSNGVIKKPDVPIYITLVLDSSGSMGGVAPALIRAAKQSLNNTPDNSLFSVVQFDEEIKLLQDFTENIPALSYAIDHYQISQKGTCLYDAAFSAVEAMAKAPVGRRAIILFTDGKDETKEGQLCSKHTYQELVDLAMSSQVPISTIGLSYKDGAINALELESLAGSTGGIAAIASQDNLATKFEDIMLALKAQWMVEAPIYPRRGNNDAVLNITLKDGSSFTTAFAVTSNTDYSGPPSPVSVRFAGLLLVAAQQSYDVQLNMASPELVEYIRIEVWDQDAGSKVDERVFPELSTSNRLSVPTELLIEKRAYQLRIFAISKQDKTAFMIAPDEDGNPSTQLVHDFVFDPSAAYPSLKMQSVVEKNGDLVLTVNVTNPDLIGGFDGWLVDETTNTQVQNSNFTAPAISTSTGTITIPTRANRIKNGQYTVVVRVLSRNNNDYSTTYHEGIIYTAPSLFERLEAALIAEPVYLFGILGIILAVVGFLMFNASRQKSLSGTPVLQGRLGGRLRTMRKGSTPLIPVADDEPISARDPFPSVSTSIKPPSLAPMNSELTGPAPTVITSAPGDSDSGNATVIDFSSMIPRAMLTDIKGGGLTPPNGSTLVAPLPFVIGRSEGTLIIADSNVSRRHAEITYDDMQHAYYLMDLNSSNGTVLNNQRLAPGQPVRLSNNSVIGLGSNVILRFDLS